MGYVLADQQGWLDGSDPFEVVPLNTFAKLREGVNQGTADFFMWEHFTSKRYYDNGEIRRIGEIYTPWSSWKIVARDPTDRRTDSMMDKINQGIEYFHQNKDEAVQYISTELDYSAEDATSWLDTVRFAEDVKGVDRAVIDRTISSLVKAGVLESAKSEDMISIERHQ
jgi:hypothetical protein